MNLVGFLSERYDYDEPILIEELTRYLSNVKPSTIRQNLKRLVDLNIVYRYKYKEGIFFIPNPDSIFKKNILSTNKVINKLYMFNDEKRVGYPTGLSFANTLSLTTQNPFILEIVTNKTNSKKRSIELNKQTIILRRPKVGVNNDNYKILQVLDLLGDFEKYSVKSLNDAKPEIINYLKDVTITKSELNNYLKNYPAKTSKKLVESGLYSEITP